MDDFRRTKSYVQLGDDRRVLNSGYIQLRREHPLAVGGWVAEHRMVLYDALEDDLLASGSLLFARQHPCHWCGWMLPWQHEDGLQFCINVDHLDEVRWNNTVENLVVSCSWCNASRSWQSVNPLLWANWVTEFLALAPWKRPPSGRWLAYLLAQMPREQVDAAIFVARELFPPVPEIPEQLLAGDLFE